MHPEEKRNTKQPFTKPIYEVGYRRPPSSEWFPKGVSGNPAGRPKGSKNKLTDQHLSHILRDEIYRLVPIDGKEGEEAISVSALRAASRNFVNSALAGNVKAIQWMLSVGQEIEWAAAAEQEKDYVFAEAHKRRWEEAIRSAKYYGRFAIPQPVPHPDHIILDERRREVTFTGPRNEAERAEYDAYIAEVAGSSGAELPNAETPKEDPLKEDPPNEEPPGEKPPNEELPKQAPPGQEPVGEEARKKEVEKRLETSPAAKEIVTDPVPANFAASAAIAGKTLGSRSPSYCE